MIHRRASARGSAGARRDLLFKAVCASFLFAYAGMVLAVLLADVLWLSRRDPVTDQRYVVTVAQDAKVREEIKYALLLSAVTSLIATLMSMVVAVPVAYALSRYTFPAARFFDTVLDLPIVIPPLIAGISLLVFFNQTLPGKYLDHVARIVYTQKGIIVAQFFVASAFSVRTLKVVFDQIGPRFEAVARSLGCTSFQAFRKVTLPLARHGMVGGLVMTWARAMGEFAPVLVLAGGTPYSGDALQFTEVLPVAAFLNMSAGRIELSIAVTVFMVVIATVTLLIFKKLGGQGYLW